MTDFDPSLVFGEDGPPPGGVRKMCTDHKRCGLGLSCEYGQVRNEACELLPLWVPDGADLKGCRNWLPRKELASENDIFRGKSRRHNQLRRSNLILPDGRKAPDPMTKRHIVDGKDIKGDD